MTERTDRFAPENQTQDSTSQYSHQSSFDELISQSGEDLRREGLTHLERYIASVTPSVNIFRQIATDVAPILKRVGYPVPAENEPLSHTTIPGEQIVLSNDRHIASSLNKTGPAKRLTPAEFGLMKILLENPQEAFTAKELQKRMEAKSKTSIKELISRLRAKIGDKQIPDESAFRGFRHIFIHSTPFGYSLS